MKLQPKIYVNNFIFDRGDHIVPNMDEAFPKKKKEETVSIF